ncbi:hypothetical protein DL93DRAFT_2131717 [Clavulina sp. PMI_390]|nr:hypothetical protein DL93DRAFT_2131717 [Clavulina sp. PMI_390]
MLRSRAPTLPAHTGHVKAPDRYGGYTPRKLSPTRGSSGSRAASFLTWARHINLTTLRRIPNSIKAALAFAFLVLIYYVYTWEIHVEVQFYKRSWVKQEILDVEPLAGCFEPQSIARDGNLYNASYHLYGPKRTEFHAGIDMRLGMDCYDFAGTIPYPPPRHHDERHHARYERTNYHTYWRADLEPFGERQEWMLKSFFSTQDLSASTLILWTNDIGPIRDNKRIALYLQAYPHAFEVRQISIEEKVKGTALEGSPRIKGTHDSKAWVDGDLVRLLVLWHWGGVWVDMDSLLTRDLTPLLDHEFVTQWDCYDKVYQPMNGALMHFRQRSPYLCEAFHIMASPKNPPPRPGSTDWGSLLYHKLWRRLLAAGIPPFHVLPSCFSEGRSCRMDNRIPDPFKPDPKSWAAGRGVGEGEELDQVLRKIFVVHLHNQWHKAFPKDGWVDRLLLRRYNKHLPKDDGGDIADEPRSDS